MWGSVDVEIVRELDPAGIGPFENADAKDGILLNHDYVDTRGYSIADAQEIENDPWTVEFGTFHRDPANRDKLTEPAGLINDREELVVAYLQSSDVLWQLGEERSARQQNLGLSIGGNHGAV